MLTRRIAELVCGNWSALGLTGAAPADLRFVKVSASARATKVILFGFPPRGRFPVVVVKLAPDQEAEERLRAAHRLLGALHRRLPRLAGVPRPLMVERVGSHLVGVETYLPGQTMYRLYPAQPSWRQRAHVARDFEAARSWLVRFHQATRSDRSPTARDLERCCDAPLEVFARCHHPTPAELAALERARGDLADAAGANLPLVCQQGDYWPRNLLLANDRLAVCDWDWSRPAELPFLDAFLFPLSYSLLLGAAPPAVGVAFDGLREALLTGSWFARLWRGYTLGYLREMGIDLSLASSFFHLTLLHMAVRDCAATGQPSRNDALHRELLRRCAEEEVVRRGWLGGLGA
ncbi:MAG TPA: phosphotransferase [Armatimonadota bacterium]|nr:phosphotransferase [Armatimonadota bacterium]